MAAGIFKSILADFESANDVFQPPAPAQLLGKESLYLTKAQAERIQVVISQLLQEIKNQENSQDEPQSPYTFAFAFYPSPHSQRRSKETV